MTVNSSKLDGKCPNVDVFLFPSVERDLRQSWWGRGRILRGVGFRKVEVQ